MGTITTLINATPANDGGNIAQMLSEMAPATDGGSISPAATPAQYAAQGALQAAWNAYIVARSAALTAFQGQ